jgi:hypothetical protein
VRGARTHNNQENHTQLLTVTCFEYFGDLEDATGRNQLGNVHAIIDYSRKLHYK